MTYGPLLCPYCRAALACHVDRNETEVICESCGKTLILADGALILVRDAAKLSAEIEKARGTAKGHWYAEQQSVQWSGPYRHHMRKRRAYVDKVVREFTADAGPDLWGLDAGCGDGGHLSWLNQYVSHLWASDYNPIRLVRAAQNLTSGSAFLADLRDYPVADDSMHLIWFNHVLEHIEDDRTVLAQLHRILRQGGRLILGVPNEGAAFWRLAYALQPGAKAASDHVHFYTLDTIGQKVRDAGFAILETESLGWGPPHWGLDARLRGFEWLDDAFESWGRRLVPGQASSLYLVLGK